MRLECFIWGYILECDNIVSSFDICDALADRLDDTCPLMTEDYRKSAFWVLPRQCVCICGFSAYLNASSFVFERTGMADTSVVYFDADFMCFWCADFDVLDNKIFARFPSNSGLVVLSDSAHVKPRGGSRHTLHVMVCHNKESVNDVERGRVGEGEGREGRGQSTFPAVSEGMM